MLNRSPTRARRAMTLVEILAVVVILALLAGTLTVGFSSSLRKAKHDIARSGIGVVVTQIEKFQIEEGRLPTTEEGLAALSDGHASPSASYYLNPGQLLDPWERSYMYITPGPDGHPFEVMSYGADGQPGGEGDNADVSSLNLRGEKQ